MNAHDLPLVGPIANTDKDVFGSFTNLAEKKLLCIGFSETELLDLVAKYNPATIVTLTNWADHGDAQVATFPLVIGDITKRTEFADDEFDAILTLSALEHLSDLAGAFEEMKRLVRDGGELIHMFGPVWSCAYGHHIYEDPNDKLLNFSLWQMPAHMHLLCSREEIVRYYVDMGYPQRAGYAAIHWFYETPIINRVFFDDYLHLFDEVGLQIERADIMYNRLPRDHVERLRTQYPGRRDFSSYGGKYKLVVSK